MKQSTNPEKGEGRLGFTSIVLRAFDFLLTAGFVVVGRKPALVRFESDHVFVNVYHGRSSYQVGLEMGRLEEHELYTLHEILSAIAPTECERARCQTTDTIVLERCIEAIAEIIKAKARPLLSGDSSAFALLEKSVTGSRREYTLQAEFGAIIDRADRAWEAKEFEQAQKLYESASPALDAIRARRLGYLRRKKGKGSAP